MEVGGFKRVVVKEEDSQLDINNELVNSVNINFDRIYKAMNSGIDFGTNINCALISIIVKHGQEQTITHNLADAPKSVAVLSGLASIILVNTDLRTITIRTYLPQTFLTVPASGNSLVVSDPYSFSVGDILVLQRTGTFDPLETAIESIDLKQRTIKIKSSVQAGAFDIVYKKQDNIKLLVF